MEKYIINGKKYTQDFLSISEILQVSELIGEIITNINTVEPFKIVRKLEKSGKLLKFLHIILKGKEPLKDTKIKPALLLKAVLDFFVLNEVGEIISLISFNLPKVTAQISGIKIPNIQKTKKSLHKDTMKN